MGIGFVLLMAVALIAYGVVNWWSSNRLENRLANLREAGEPTSIKDLKVTVPADDNAALVLEKVRPQLEAFTKALVTFLDKTPQGVAYSESAFKPSKPTDEQINMIRSILAMYPEIPSAIEEAANCNYHASSYDFSIDPHKFLDELLPANTLVRNAVRFAGWQMVVAIADEDYDRTAQIGINTLQLARLYDQEPMLVSGLVALALRGVAVRDLNRVLRSGEISPETRLLVDQELAGHDDPMWFVNVLKTERAYSLDTSGDLFPHFPMTWQGRILKGDILSMYEELLPIVTKPWHESRYEIQEPFDRSYSTPISTTMIQLYTPALNAAHEAYHRTIAEIRCLRILNSLQAYKDGTGREAESLDDLDLSTSAMLDPFDGKPLKLKMTDEGWLIYSAYRNRKDDGGELEPMNDVGVAPLGYPGGE